MHLLPGGEVFYTPTGWHSGGCSGAADYPAAKPSGFFEFLSTSPPVKASWTDIGTQDAAAEDAIDRVKGMAVLLVQPSYPFVQAMVVGGGKDPESATTFQMINLSTIVPKWGPPVTLPDGLPRVNVPRHTARQCTQQSPRSNAQLPRSGLVQPTQAAGPWLCSTATRLPGGCPSLR